MQSRAHTVLVGVVAAVVIGLLAGRLEGPIVGVIAGAVILGIVLVAMPTPAATYRRRAHDNDPAAIRSEDGKGDRGGGEDANPREVWQANGTGVRPPVGHRTDDPRRPPR